MIEILKIDDDSYQFKLKSPSGGTILNSIGFKSEDAVHQMVSNLDGLIKKPAAFERKTNHSGKFQFNLKDGSGKTIGHSQLYDSEAGMENGIKNLRRSISSMERL